MTSLQPRTDTEVRLASLTVGGIDYLNALPLTAYLQLDGSPQLTLRNLPPSALADGLRSGELDIALVPVVEYLANPLYRVLPEMCISSYGAVESIRLYYRGELEAVRKVALDKSSRTSAMLTRLFFRLLWDGKPVFEDLDPQVAQAYLASVTGQSVLPSGCTEDIDAVLLIGDAALCREAPAGWQQIDLGNEWTRWTGLPFVYAFWVWRGESPLPQGLVERFQTAKEVGLSRIDDIVRDWAKPEGLEGFRCLAYLSRAIQYDLGSAQEEGVARFFELLDHANLHRDAPSRLRIADARS